MFLRVDGEVQDCELTPVVFVSPGGRGRGGGGGFGKPQGKKIKFDD